MRKMVVIAAVLLAIVSISTGLLASKQNRGDVRLDREDRFYELDLNGDVVLTIDEFPCLDLTFDRIDINGDGEISFDEWMAW